MHQPGLDGRHRDKDGEISRKHGNTLVSTLRKIYGADFALGFSAHEKLSFVLNATGTPSLSKLHRDMLYKAHAEGTLENKISIHSR
jgi:hypothetical protein